MAASNRGTRSRCIFAPYLLRNPCACAGGEWWSLYLLKKVFELLDAALGPAEAALGVTQVGHDESVLPRAVSRARPAQVTWRRRAVVDAAESAICERIQSKGIGIGSGARCDMRAKGESRIEEGGFRC